MSATPSLRPMFAFPGWVIERIDIDWNIKHAFVHLRRDGRIQHLNADTGETLFLGEGKRKEVLDQFLSSLTAEQKASIDRVYFAF